MTTSITNPQPWTYRFGVLLIGFGYLSLISAGVLPCMGLLGWQILIWLRSGQWPPVSIANELAYGIIPILKVGWGGMQSFVCGFLLWLVSVSLFATGVLLGSALIAIGGTMRQFSKIERQEAEARLRMPEQDELNNRSD